MYIRFVIKCIYVYSAQDGKDMTYLGADDISILSDSSASSWPSMREWKTSSNSSTNKSLGKSVCFNTMQLLPLPFLES